MTTSNNDIPASSPLSVLGLVRYIYIVLQPVVSAESQVKSIHPLAWFVTARLSIGGRLSILRTCIRRAESKIKYGAHSARSVALSSAPSVVKRLVSPSNELVRIADMQAFPRQMCVVKRHFTEAYPVQGCCRCQVSGWLVRYSHQALLRG